MMYAFMLLLLTSVVAVLHLKRFIRKFDLLILCLEYLPTYLLNIFSTRKLVEYEGMIDASLMLKTANVASFCFLCRVTVRPLPNFIRVTFAVRNYFARESHTVLNLSPFEVELAFYWMCQWTKFWCLKPLHKYILLLLLLYIYFWCYKQINDQDPLK